MESLAEAFVHRLPSELLAQIFLSYHYDCVDDDRSGPTLFITPSTHKSPLSLLLICRRWTQTVNQTPELWASLNLVFKAPPKAGKEGVGLQNWLRRAGSYPLSLSFMSRNLYPQPKPPTDASTKDLRDSLEFVTQIIGPCIPRCRILAFGLPPPFAQHIADLFASEMPLLEVLTLSNAPRGSLTSIDLTHCPRLGEVRVGTSYDFNPRLRFDQALFPNLRDVVTTDNMDQAWQILANAPSVVKADLLFRNPDVYTTSLLSPQSHILHLSKLNHLEINTSSRVDPALFYASLFVPALQSLQVDFGSEDNSENVSWPHLNSMLRQSRPPLESLTISNIPGSTLDVLQMLYMVPNLKDLNIIQTRISDWFWTALTDEVGHTASTGPPSVIVLREEERRFLNTCGCLCPDLKKLHIRFGGDQNPSLVASMISSRLQRPLKSFVLFKCGFEEEELIALAGIRECMTDGLELEIQANWGLS